MTIRERLRSSGYAPVLAVVGTILLAVLPWHPTCPIFEGSRMVMGLCTFSPPLRDPTALEWASVILFAAALSWLPLKFPNPLALIVLGLTSAAVIIVINFSFEAFFALVRLGLAENNQEARYGLLLLFPASTALVVAGVFRLVAPILRSLIRNNSSTRGTRSSATTPPG